MASDFIGFQKKLDSIIAETRREPHWDAEEARRYMREVSGRRGKYDQIAPRLITQIIHPLVEALAERFPNATFQRNLPSRTCGCWFGYCERFPASTKMTFSIEHDVRFEKVFVCFDASMSPPFIKLNEHDKKTLSLDEVNDEVVWEWAQERLVEFLDDYLRIDRGLDDFEDEIATDPVCGMRFTRNHSATSLTYLVRQYYFCSQDCYERFTREPTAYVEVALD